MASTVRFNVSETYEGYYIRVLCKTPYGQVYAHSEYILNGGN